MKRALFLLPLLLAACSDGGSPTTATAPAGDKMKVALLVSGSTSDGGWNQLAQSSLDGLAKNLPIDVRTRQNVSKDNAADALRQFDAQGFSLVIAHGYEFLGPVTELTDPKSASPLHMKIAVSGGDSTSPNFASLAYDLAGPSYQLGVVAAKTTKSKKLGFIGGEAVPTVTAMEKGFEAGAKSVDPAITVSAQYTGWDDPAKSKTQAEAFFNQGIDVVMQNVDAASSGVFEAVKEHNTAKMIPNPVYTFGANADQNANPICGDYVLGSAVIHLDKAFAAVISQVQTGSFKGGLIPENVSNGVTSAVLNPKLLGTVISKETEAAAMKEPPAHP